MVRVLVYLWHWNEAKEKGVYDQQLSKWANWAEWGRCSVSCGTGRTRRQRTCLGGVQEFSCPGQEDEKRKLNHAMDPHVPCGHNGVSGQAVQHSVVLAIEQGLDPVSLPMVWKAGIAQVNLLRQHFVREHRAVDGRTGVLGPCAIGNAEQVTVSALELA
ncbi:thrombospondin type 1 domain protein [Ancylostoma ceylanicum]|uniref:Thrombospondin type 1 domain protein n=1 Tax=Ancylostoma ceylanicum TaxID=53326 RepID=A0A0D6LSI6_9BILA|nr:thrombospondin type 1 domain protein [Ancylostoma ceylanicum]